MIFEQNQKKLRNRILGKIKFWEKIFELKFLFFFGNIFSPNFVFHNFFSENFFFQRIFFDFFIQKSFLTKIFFCCWDKFDVRGPLYFSCFNLGPTGTRRKQSNVASNSKLKKIFFQYSSFCSESEKLSYLTLRPNIKLDLLVISYSL